MKPPIKPIGPYPLASDYTDVVRDGDFEVSLKAEVISVPGDNVCGGDRNQKHYRPGDSAPMVLQQSLSPTAAPHPAARGPRPPRRLAIVVSPRPTLYRRTDTPLPKPAISRSRRECASDKSWRQRHARYRFYQRVAIAMHPLWVAMCGAPPTELVQDWNSRYHRGTLVTGGFTGVTANRFGFFPDPRRGAWLYLTRMPPL